MAEDWAPGDLALIINKSPVRCPSDGGCVTHTGRSVPAVGTVHEVKDVVPSLTHYVGKPDSEYVCGCIELWFAGGGDRGAASWRCVKVTPTEEDEFDKEIIALYQMEPEPVTGRANPERIES